MSGFLGFDVGGAVEVRIRSYTVGQGGSAELQAVGLEVERAGGVVELVEIAFDEGPSLATAKALVAALNRRLRERRAEGG